MGAATAALCATAAAIGVVHTLAGPDHWVPFVAMSRAGRWSQRRTLLVTALCGAGHVLGSVALGAVGIAIGAALFTMESIEAARGALAGWLLIAFGAAYLVWALRRALRREARAHEHVHADGTRHSHPHDRRYIHGPARADHDHARVMTPWMLFTIFVLGPCESLIPLLMVPAASGADGVGAVVVVTVTFALATIGTMLAAVSVATRAAQQLEAQLGERWRRAFARYAHVAAGAAMLGCGAAVRAGL